MGGDEAPQHKWQGSGFAMNDMRAVPAKRPCDSRGRPHFSCALTTLAHRSKTPQPPTVPSRQSAPRAEGSTTLRHAPIGQARHCSHVRERNRQIASLTDSLTAPPLTLSRPKEAAIHSLLLPSRAPACSPTAARPITDRRTTAQQPWIAHRPSPTLCAVSRLPLAACDFLPSHLRLLCPCVPLLRQATGLVRHLL